MAKEETDISHNIMIDLAPMGVTLFKNVRGLFLTLDGKRKVKAGLQPNGSSDLVGFTRVKVTPDMVGSTVAVFTVMESKTMKGKANAEQINYMNTVRACGGYAGVVRCTKDAIKIIRKPFLS